MEIAVGRRPIGHDRPVFVIAEAGVNHGGDVDLAICLVDAAANAGADAVKFQTFKAERVVGKRGAKAGYQKETTDPGESQLEMLRRLELPFETHEKLRDHCIARGIEFLSSPFDDLSLDFLCDLGVPAIKIGSGELTNLPFLARASQKHRPILLSTGMSYLSEVDEAVRCVRGAGCSQLVLLHCLTNYPAPADEINLRAMQVMRSAFAVPVGYSDHTLGIEVALAAVAAGACVIEKHMTLDRTAPGPDHRASLEPEEFKAMVKAIRNVEQALGDGVKQPAVSEADCRAVARRSLAAARDLPAGSVLRAEDLCALRPGHGIPPGMMETVIGKTMRRGLDAGELLSWEVLG